MQTIDAAVEINKGNSSQDLVYPEADAPKTNWEAHHHCKWEHSTQPIFAAAKPTCWRTMELPQPLNSKSFQKLLDHKVIVLNSVTGSLAHLQIGRAYAMGGDTTKAKSAYQDFLTLWKDADPDIPILKEAKTEYAKLQ